MTVTFDDKGLLVDSQDDVFNAMVASAKTRLAPYLQGTPLQTDESSVLGRLLRIVSVPAYSNGEVLQTIMNQFDINTAEGLQLDYLGWNIHRIKRLGLAQATGMVVVGGDSGVIVSEGSLVSNSITGDSFRTQEDVTFDDRSVSGVVIRVDSVEQTYTITYSIDGYLSTYPRIEVAILQETTIPEIANRLANAVNSQASLLRAVVNNDNTVTIMLNDPIATADFGFSEGISLAQSYKQVYIESVTYQSSEAKVGAISSIQSSVLGWRSVYNYIAIGASRPVETDEEYRSRLNLTLGYNVGSYDAVWMRLMTVRGVSFVNIKENLSASSQDGIVNTGLAITIQGGTDDEVAQAIYNCIPVGIYTNGMIEKSVKDLNGGNHTVRFSRPIQVPLEISMSITVYNDFPANGKQLIKQAIVDWFNSLRVGDDIYYSRLYEPINKIGGFSVSSLTIAKQGEPQGTANIPMGYNEIPVVSADRIFIGGI